MRTAQRAVRARADQQSNTNMRPTTTALQHSTATLDGARQQQNTWYSQIVDTAYDSLPMSVVLDHQASSLVLSTLRLDTPLTLREVRV